MHLEVTFRNLSPRAEIRRRSEALFEKLHRFLDDSADGQLTVGVEHGQAVVELVINRKGEALKAGEEHEDMRTALDKTFHSMEGQLRRSKERRIDRTQKGIDGEDGFEVPDADDALDEDEVSV